MVTEQEIVEAEAEAEAAEAVLDRAEAHHETAGSVTAVNELRAARAEATAARDKVRRLRSQWAREQASEARRAEAEAAFPQRRREALTGDLSAARDEAAAAVAALDGAVRAALEKVTEYSVLVQQTAGEMAAAGLRRGEGGPDGGGRDGSVCLGAEQWWPVDGLETVEFVLATCVAVTHPSHPLAMRRYGTGSLAGKAGREDLLRAAGR